ncbi:sensor histidine kinase [Microbacterium sp. ARD32]|uniref:sensor histidine kinase n=1 Tax=Microbacterium sp. ARD32 TaxID=2962577 RepID=UPI0028825F90|nr:sensor histidine kinase [Microbacterium sp. ARD32]MDT0157359.1 sensor histidine kinase [Microbacterium sp. ARD32]
MPKQKRREHERSRRPSAGRDRGTLIVIVLGVVAIALLSVMAPVHAAVYGSDVAATIVFAGAAAGAPLVALRHPSIAAATFTIAALALALLIPETRTLTGPWPWTVPLLIAFAVTVATLTIAHGWRRGLTLYLLGSLAGVTASATVPTTPSGNSLIVTTSIVGAVLLVAALLAGRLRVGAELDRQRRVSAEEQERRLQIEERTRIARELHDVVAHSMSVIQVQASTARYRLPDLPEVAIAEFEDMAATTRGSLAEMRRLLGVLRTEDQPAELAPQQGIDAIPGLVESIRRAGADVSLELVAANLSAVSAGVQVTAFRIVQEALSNAVRHAPGSPITVRIGQDAEAVSVRVHNVAATDPAPAAPAGHGLRGMRERVALVAGTLETGPDPDGGWTVIAVLPWTQKQENA